MFSYLERLRHEPLDRRRSIALAVTMVLLAIVVALWVVFSVLRTALFSPEQDAPERRTVEGIVAPF